jgi:hypothetical protein
MGQLTDHLVGAQKPFLRRSAHTGNTDTTQIIATLSQYQESGEAVMMLAGRARRRQMPRISAPPGTKSNRAIQEFGDCWKSNERGAHKCGH